MKVSTSPYLFGEEQRRTFFMHGIPLKALRGEKMGCTDSQQSAKPTPTRRYGNGVGTAALLTKAKSLDIRPGFVVQLVFPLPCVESFAKAREEERTSALKAALISGMKRSRYQPRT